MPPASHGGPRPRIRRLHRGARYLLVVLTFAYPPGTYTLSFMAGGDPTTHTATFVVTP